ncbi:hypothetical protein Riggi_5 [Bacillus phage Riggi]|uniref:Uncharacterized protein n=1 Tax=Bacillus phage Riggi TaxID=2884426 RepID=U5PZU2_9CAUD|nr:hypothetical protein Riggi_5 [Bacillus phage Riggi]AGY48167.1 hypothetical protein Riggi_5 [Bacillus phage Riggi]
MGILGVILACIFLVCFIVMAGGALIILTSMTIRMMIDELKRFKSDWKRR